MESDISVLKGRWIFRQTDNKAWLFKHHIHHPTVKRILPSYQVETTGR